MAEPETKWFRDPERYTRWCLDLRRLILTADDVLEAATHAGPDGQAHAVLNLRGSPQEIAEAMTVAADGLRRIADILEEAVATGFADAGVQPIPGGPEGLQ